MIGHKISEVFRIAALWHTHLMNDANYKPSVSSMDGAFQTCLRKPLPAGLSRVREGEGRILMLSELGTEEEPAAEPPSHPHFLSTSTRKRRAKQLALY